MVKSSVVGVSMRFARLAVTIGAAVLVVLCVAFAAWLYGPPPSVPAYPNQQQAQTRTERLYGDDTLTTTTFFTTDAPGVVLDYYRQHLGPFRSDWYEGRLGQKPLTENDRATRDWTVFTYNEEYWFQPSTELWITTRVDTSTGLLEVVVRLHRQ